MALQRAGISVSKYYVSEVDKSAILVSSTNYPDIVQLGDVKGITIKSLPDVPDLLLAGSPCQGFSSAGKGLNFSDPRSALFFEFVRIWRELLGINPKARVLLENVVMRPTWRDIITIQARLLPPIMIDAALVSAQSRKRLYWTNIPGVTQPADRGILLKDILEPSDYFLGAPNKACIVSRRLNASGVREDYNKQIPITQCLEVRAYNPNKACTITTVDKDNVLSPLPPGRYRDAFKRNLPFRYYTQVELERLQGLPDGYTKPVSRATAVRLIGNAWNVDVITYIFDTILN
ncbi:MAG: DNA cytosine methyltransferase [Chitinophagales bacterium]|nr:DNA cytosine methyltransferase [Chitinophagales bacterium]